MKKTAVLAAGWGESRQWTEKIDKVNATEFSNQFCHKVVDGVASLMPDLQISKDTGEMIFQAAWKKYNRESGNVTTQQLIEFVVGSFNFGG